MLKLLFRWFDGHPQSYWVIGGFFLALWLVWTGCNVWRDESFPPIRRRGVITGLLLLAVLLAWRWPLLLNPQEYNPDESQLLAGAITLQHDPVFWRSVDGTTSGPLNFFALLPTHWLGVPQDFFNARLTAVLLYGASLWCCYWFFSTLFRHSLALLGLFPPVLLFIFATDPDRDLIHYSSEYTSIFLLMVATALIRKAEIDSVSLKSLPGKSWLPAGLCLGLLPWAKLQSVPLGLTLAAWAMTVALRRRDSPWSLKWRDLIRLVICGLTPTALILATVAALGLWKHFYTSYILDNIVYVGRGFAPMGILAHMFRICSATYCFPVFLIAPVVAIVTSSLVLAWRRQRPSFAYSLSGILTFVAIYSALVPGQAYPHYLLFTVMPLTCWTLASLGEISAGRTSRTHLRILALCFGIVSFVGPVVARSRVPVPEMFGKLEESWRHPYSDCAQVLRRLKQPGDTIAVWGWDSQIYVHSALPQGTRESHSTRQLWESPLRDTYYRPRYMEDLEHNRPAFFYDAVGFESFHFQDRTAFGHEKFAPLRDYVSTHYVFYRDFGSVRLYVRPDRMPAAH